MRIVAFIASTLVTSALLIGGLVLLVLQSGDQAGIWFVAETFAMIMFVYGPLMIGSFRAYWNVNGSQESRRYFRRVSSVVIGLEIVAAIVTVVFALTTSASALVPIVFIGGGVVLTVAALWLGPVLSRYDLAHSPAESAWVAINPVEIRKRVVWAAVTFVGVLVVGVIAITLLNRSVTHPLDLGLVFTFALAFALFAAALVCLFSTLGWNRRIRDVTDRDPARLRRVARVVLRKKTDVLDDRDLLAAARYAAVISVTMSFQVAYFVLLSAALILQQVVSIRGRFAAPFAIYLIVALIAMLVVLLPLQVVRIRRARRYAREHPAELQSA